jgi:arabinogalactan endo-1,4-beta-galactosidase
VKIFLYCVIVFSFQAIVLPQVDTSSFIRGIDISTAQQIEDAGGVWKVNGTQEDILNLFKENGVNYVRLRLWHTPAGGYCGLDSTLKFARLIKAKRFKFLLDIHYSDTWADPGHQIKPAAWENLTFLQLKDSVYYYSYNVIAAFKNQNTLPDMVQIGNEITGGMLWPDGKNYGSSDSWTNFASLVKEGIQGVRDAAGRDTVKIMIHIDQGGNNSTCRWFFDSLITSQSVRFDVIGLSYYPWYTSHGTLTQLQNNLNDLAARYNKNIVIVETAYPWTSGYVNDGVSNVGFDSTNLPKDYSISPSGQKDYLTFLRKLIEGVNNKKGIGFFYWEPAYISVSPVGSAWENYAMFDFNGNAFSSLQVFRAIDSVETVINYSGRNSSINSFELFQNYPNPFNPSTEIKYSIALLQNSNIQRTKVKLEVFDILGNKVATLVNGYQEPGIHTVTFLTQYLKTGRQITSGIYFYRLTAGKFAEVKKMILLR